MKRRPIKPSRPAFPLFTAVLPLFVSFLALAPPQTVRCEVTAERLMPETFYLPGQKMICIKIRMSGDDATLSVRETIPPGWTFHRPPVDSTVEGNTFAWEAPFNGNRTIFYYVNAPGAPMGDAVFEGTANGAAIGGPNVLRYLQPEPGKQVPMDSGLAYKYWLYLPPDYSDGGGPWPLAVFLHGPCFADEAEFGAIANGYTNTPPYILNRPELVETYPELFTGVVVSPHSRSIEWNASLLEEFIEDVLASYSIDPRRIYMMGHAHGGACAWDYSCSHPDKVAAFVAVLGGLPPVNKDNAGMVPFWAFQAENDTGISPGEVEAAANRVRENGGSANHTVFPPEVLMLHEASFGNPEVYAWLFRQGGGTASAVPFWEMY